MHIDKIPLDQLHNRAEQLLLGLRLEPSRYIMALVDHLFLYEQADLFACWPAAKPQILNLYDHLSGGEERISPLLIPLPFIAEELLPVTLHLLKRCNTHPMLSILTSPLEPSVIAPHLASLTSILLPPDQESYLLRFADTRIVPTLYQLLDPTQRAQLFGVFDRWAYIDRKGEWATVKGGGLLDIPPGGPMRLSEAQFEAFLQASHADNFMLTLREHSVAFSDMPPSAQYRLVCHWIEAAKDVADGAIQPGECLAYCLSRLPFLQSSFG